MNQMTRHLRNVARRKILIFLVLLLVSCLMVEGKEDGKISGTINIEQDDVDDDGGGVDIEDMSEFHQSDDVEFAIVPRETGIPLVRHDEYSNNLLYAEAYQSYIQALAYPARLVVRPDSSSVAEESKISFFCRADGNPLPSVIWRINGKSINDHHRISIKSLSTGLSTLRIENVTKDDNSTVISCSADNGVANPVVAEATLTVIPRDKLPNGFPQIDQHPTLKSVEQGKTAFVSCKVSGDPRAKVLWLRDLIPIDVRADGRYSIATIGNPGALMIQQAREDDQGKYECIARNSLGVAHSKAANLYVKVRRVPPYFSVKLEKEYVVGLGGSINLTCVAVGYPWPRVFWKKTDQQVLDDPSTAPMTKNVLTLTNVESTENFTCVAVSNLGNIEATTTVVVKELPPAPSNIKVSSVTSESVVITWNSADYNEPISKYIVKYRLKSPEFLLSSEKDLDDEEYADKGRFKSLETTDTSIVIENLIAFQTYEFLVQSVSPIVGPGLASISVEAQTMTSAPSTPPTNPQARSLSRDSILVKWSPTDQPNGVVTGHKVYYLPIDDTDTKHLPPLKDWNIHEAKADEFMTTIYSLNPDSRYLLKIVASNSEGDSPASQLVTVSTKQGIPGQPAQLKAKSLDSRRMQLSWEKPLFSSPISGYTVRYNTTDGEKELTITSPHEKHVINGLHPDKYYSFRVAAYSERGQGEFTEPVVTKTIASIPISAPKIVTASATSSRSIEVHWKGPEGKGLNGGNLTAYRITYRHAKPTTISKDSEDYDDEDDTEIRKSANKFIVVRAETTTYLLTGLQPFSTYEITVAASTLDGYGPDSSPVSVVKTLEDVPAAPQNFNAELTSATSVKLTWDEPDGDNTGLVGFYVHIDRMMNGEPVIEKNNKKRTLMIKDSKRRHYEMDSLDPNTEYSFRLNAFNRLGDGEFTERRKVVTQGIAPSAPEIVAVSLERDDPPVVARIEWKTPRLRHNETPIEKYNLWLRPQGYSGTYTLKKTVAGTEKFTTISGLLMGVSYDVILSAENREGQSENATETIATPIGTPEREPMNVQYEISDGKIVVSWRPPAEHQRNGNITTYTAVLTPMDASGERFEKTIHSPTTTATFEVNVQRAYTFKVAASTMKGIGPYSPVLTMNPDLTAAIGPPTNVRVEALSNSSVVVQWDFESVQADSFVVKYSHEPEAKKRETWIPQVVDGNVRHAKIYNLNSHKPYAFCVLAVKNNRQGQCSEPNIVLDKITPTYMVQNFRVLWKTSNSVKLAWDYEGPRNIGFFLNHTGHKDYYDQNLELKTMTTPGYGTELNGNNREYLWQQLRPHMKFKFEIGVRADPPGGRKYWPVEVHTQTDSTGPPFVEAPKLLDTANVQAGQKGCKLAPSTEEYGEISYYYIIVVPANYSQENLVNLNRDQLERATALKRNSIAKSLSVSPAKRLKRKLTQNMADSEPEKKRHKREELAFPGVYVTAKLSSEHVKESFAHNKPFIVGDSKTYDGYVNYPLEPNQQYRLMMRAFAKNDARPRNTLEQRAPMGEMLDDLYSDSPLTESFTTRAGLRSASQKSSPWLGACIAFLVLFSIVAMLICWWLRCNKKSAGRHPRHGSITKVALTGNIMNGMNGETSKLLNNGTNHCDSYGRGANPYDTMDLYPLPAVRHVPVPVPLPSLPVSVGGLNQVTHPSIPLPELSSHIERLRNNNNQGFQNEFESVETGQTFTWEHSSAECNKHKNRYANVAAYDHTRVILSNDDYINANYIDGYDKPKCYIATQGPLPETFSDFWRMVWEEGSATIVMLTNLEERSRIKCDQYWPSRGSATYGDVMVTLLESVQLAHYTMRTMRLQVAGEPEVREIKHLQYTAWPDHGVPDHPTPFLIFLKRVKTLNPTDAGPIISHCSAGIGRTGAFIVIDCMLERLRYENTVDIYGCVTALRAQRSYMVQTEEQYIFIHDAVLDAVNSGSTDVPAARLHQHVQALMQPVDGMSGIDREFRHLTTLKWTNNRCQIANLPVNRPKNRVLSSVPYDANRVILQMIPGIDGSDYINASWIDGYKERGAYMAMQAPLNETAADFWRAIWEHQCSIIVMLVNTWERGQEQSSEYWPLETGVQVGKLVVEPIAEYNMEHYILREFRLTDFQTNESRTVRHFQFIEWPEYGRPDNAEHFIDFVSQVHRAYSQFGVSGPITVHCTSGAGRTAVFISLAIILDRMRAEHVVDVFTTVKLLRTERQNMIQDNEQYQFLYQATFEYLASYDNFVQ